AVFARNPDAVAVVESALVFEVERDARARGESEGVLADWRLRFDRVIVVTAPTELTIARYVAKIVAAGGDAVAARADALLRLDKQIPDAEKAARADYVLDNSGDLDRLRRQTDAVWQRLRHYS
ncbi:MAG TPA: dephospho-CoA kinase, partial [Terriglobia bacterium]|nr:dephospho-CoA kinase [Terriglobia bacterium]